MGEKALNIEIENDNLVELIVTKQHQMFPKGKQYNEDGEFAIISCQVKKTIQGNPKIDKDWGTIVIKGNVPPILSGKGYYLIAQETYDERFKNYSYDVSHIAEETTELEIIEMALREVTSESLADKILKLDKVEDIFTNGNTTALQEVNGIGQIMAVKIMEKYQEKIKYGEFLLRLSALGLTSRMLNILIDRFGNYETIYNKVKENPYMLIDNVNGIGFTRADELAREFGVAENSPKRVRAYVLNYLKNESLEGKSFVLTTDVLNSLRSQTNEIAYPISKEVVGKVFNQMKEAEELWWNENKSILALAYIRQIEENIARHFKRLINADVERNISDWEAVVSTIEKKNGFKYTNEQYNGIETILKNNVVLVTGLAGTGKTSVLQPMTNILVDQQKKSILQVALAGKASQRMQEVTGYPAMTIHRGLNFDPKTGKFIHDEFNKMTNDIYILDEASMVDAKLFESLIQAIPTGAKFVIVGDYGQLPPIGFGQVFLDLIESGKVPVVKLTEIHRQAEKSAVITEAREVRGANHIVDFGRDIIETRGELQDFDLHVLKSKDLLMKQILKTFQEKVKENDIMETQVVVATKVRGDLSAFKINTKIKSLINPIQDLDMFFESRVDAKHKYKISVGDKIIITENYYQAEIFCTDTETTKGAIFNGNLGTVVDIWLDCVILDIIGVGLVKIPKSKYYIIDLGYAITCHKCIVGDTLILTQNGLKTIKDVVDNEKDIVFNGIELEQPSDYIEIGKEQTFKVTTSRGYSITGTDDHKLDVLDNDGLITVKTIKEITEGDTLLLRMDSNVFGDNKNFPEKCYNLPTLDSRTKIYKDYPKELNKDLSELLGMIVADGTLTRERLKFSKRHLDVSLRFANIINKYFGYEVEPKLRLSGDYMCEVSSIYIANFFNSIDGLQPHKKNIPTIIMETTKENQCAFLRGLFEDGSVGMKQDKFDNITLLMGKDSKELIKKVQQMLLNIGIISTFRKIEQGQKIGYALYIYRDYADIFLKDIGFISVFKQERLKKCIINMSGQSSKKTAPFIKNIMREVVYDNLEIEIKDSNLKAILLGKGEKATREITRTMLERFVVDFGHLEDERVAYVKRFFKEIYPDKIVSIENKGYQDVYCLTMPKTHKFIQNGFMAGNSQGSGWDNVIVAFDSSAYVLLSCQWLYTAMTRTKEQCWLIAENKAVRQCCETVQRSDKTTFLPSMLDQFFPLTEEELEEKRLEEMSMIGDLESGIGATCLSGSYLED